MIGTPEAQSHSSKRGEATSLGQHSETALNGELDADAVITALLHVPVPTMSPHSYSSERLI